MLSYVNDGNIHGKKKGKILCGRSYICLQIYAVKFFSCKPYDISVLKTVPIFEKFCFDLVTHFFYLTLTFCCSRYCKAIFYKFSLCLILHPLQMMLWEGIFCFFERAMHLVFPALRCNLIASISLDNVNSNVGRSSSEFIH